MHRKEYMKKGYNSSMENILYIDKPKGVTSYDVIRKLKSDYPKGTKIGHAGTLDPNATGLMIVGINEGTKKLKDFLGMNKEYVAEILLGTQTDSGDITGKIIATQNVPALTHKQITEILQKMVGPLRLPVSKFSAKKIGGKRSHKLAREGLEMPTILQDMDLLEYELLSHDPSSRTTKVRMLVSSGTYIRSLTEELARRLNTVATLKNLRRTKIGDVVLADIS